MDSYKETSLSTLVKSAELCSTAKPKIIPSVAKTTLPVCSGVADPEEVILLLYGDASIPVISATAKPQYPPPLSGLVYRIVSVPEPVTKERLTIKLCDSPPLLETLSCTQAPKVAVPALLETADDDIGLATSHSAAKAMIQLPDATAPVKIYSIY